MCTFQCVYIYYYLKNTATVDLDLLKPFGAQLFITDLACNQQIRRQKVRANFPSRVLNKLRNL